jgi:Uma2 family endonuclease
MSALPRYPREDVGTSHAGLRMAAEEYLALGETSNRYELVNGVVFMSPSPSSKHQRIVRRLLAQLDTACEQFAGLEALGDYDVVLAPGLVYQPDVCVFAPGRFKETAEHSIVPDLAVEVLSPSSKAYDLITKRQDYERFGVREYWVIDQDDGSVRCWVRRGAAFQELKVEGDRLESTAIPGLVIDLRPLRPDAG